MNSFTFIFKHFYVIISEDEFPGVEIWGVKKYMYFEFLYF